MLAPVRLIFFNFAEAIMAQAVATWPKLNQPIGTPTAINILMFLRKFKGSVHVVAPGTSKILGTYHFHGKGAEPRAKPIRKKT